MGTDAFTKFWSPKFAAGSTLAKFAVTLGKAAVTEAAVERSFSAQVGCKISVTPPTPLSQGRVYSKRREPLGETSCEAQTWLMMNYMRVMAPEDAAQEAMRRAAKRAAKRTQAEDAFNALVQKRQRSA